MDWVAFFFGLAVGLILKSLAKEKPKKDEWTETVRDHVEKLLVGQEFYFVFGKQWNDDRSGGDDDDLSGFDTPRFKKNEMN